MTSTVATPSTRRVSLFHLALLVPWVALVIDAYDRIGDNSYLWHIRAGEIQIAAAEVLTTDPFSFTRFGEPWITQSWLVELFYGWAESLGGVGFTAPMMLTASLVAIIGIGVITHQASKSVPATAVVVLLTTVLFLRFLVPRPVLFSYPLFVLVVLAFQRRAPRWTLPFLFWIWASVHASFVIGLAYIGLSIVSNRDWKAIRVAVVAGLATLLTTHGLSVVTMLFDFVGSRQYLELVSEWRTPDFLEIAMLPVLIGIVLIIYGAMKGRLQPASLWVIAPFLALAFSAERAVATAWIAMVPFVGVSVSGLSVRNFRGFPIRVAAVFVGAIALLPWAFINPVEIDPEMFPIEAAAILQDVPTFHDDFAGGYLIWSRTLEPGVFIDDRVELYGERVEEFAGVRSGRLPFEPVFQRDGIAQALLRTYEPLVDDLSASGWVSVYEDEQYTVMLPGPG